ncbi:MAG: hypothetical protein R3D60_08990 [Paracoccaceae bacterium]
MAERQTGEVRRRQVFYLPGFDPFPPRRYRELYRREGLAQAAISGYRLSLSPQEKGSPGYGWTVRTRIGETRTEAHVAVLVWADLVQESMTRGILGTYALLARTAWIYAASGALVALVRLRVAPMIAAFWPVVMLLGQLLIAVLLGYAAGWAVALVIPGAVGVILGAGALFTVAWAVLHAFRRYDGKLYAYYLMYDFAHVAARKGAYAPELVARMREFADRVEAALGDPSVDEVLVVGHSSGAALGVSVLADVLRRGMPEGGPLLAFLTLGHAVPMQSYLPEAHALRRDLRALSEDARLTWVDISAKGDGCCFSLCDPVACSGVAGPDQRWPLVVSAAFSESLRPETWRKLRRRFFRLHFQYLAAFDNPRDYDYFQITAGPMTLAARYGGRNPSPSRRAVSFNPHGEGR